METLNHQDMQSLHEGIQQLYTFCDLDTFGVNALSIVDRLVPGDVPEFHVTNLNTQQISSTFLPNFPGFTAKMKRVMQKHFSEHPVAQHMPQTLDGVYKISDFISRQKLDCLEGLYQQFLRLIDTEDQIIFFLPQPNPASWQELSETNAILMGFSIHRTWGEFTERDRLVLNLLRPHLFQSHQNAQKYHRLQQNTIDVQQSIDGLRAIIIDSQGRIQSIASQAAIWLEIYFERRAGRNPLHSWMGSSL